MAFDMPIELYPWHSFGVYGPVRENIAYVSETQIVYPTGHHLALQDTESNAMEFFQQTHMIQSIQAMIISTSCEELAVSQRVYKGLSTTIDEPWTTFQTQLALYSLSKKTLLKTIPLPTNTTVVSLALSKDTKTIAVLENTPQPALSIWKWSTGKCVGSISLATEGTRIRICPCDPTLMTISGKQHLKAYSSDKEELRSINLLPQIKEQENFVDHLWVVSRLIALTESGTLFIFLSDENSPSTYEFRHTINCRPPRSCVLKTMTLFKEGFLVGGSHGFISLYESSNDLREPFLMIKSFGIGEYVVNSMSVCPNSQHVAAYTQNQNLMTFSLGNIEMIQDNLVDSRPLSKGGTHAGAVCCIDGCEERPIVATCGIDKTVRIWNYKTRQCESVYELSEEPTALTLHPTGYHLILGTRERVRVCSVLHDEIRVLKELSIKRCNELEYAQGGHLFACAMDLTIVVIHSYSHEIKHTFKGHIGVVKRLVWSHADRYLHSAGQDGGIYGWDLMEGKRMDNGQHVVKNCKYNALVVDHRDESRLVAAGNDGKLREIFNGEEVRCMDVSQGHGMCITHMVLSPDNRYLLAGTSCGGIILYQWPIFSRHRFEVGVHHAAVRKLCLLAESQVVLSCAEDGTVSVMDFTIPDPGASTGASSSIIPRVDKNVLSHEIVLIPKEDIEEMNVALNDMQMKYDQIKSDTEYALHRQETEWIERLRVTKEEGDKLLMDEQHRSNELQERHESIIRSHSEVIAHKDEDHVRITQELENQYEHKLSQEISRSVVLSEEMETMRQRCEALLDSQEKHHQKLLQEDREKYQANLHEKNDLIKQLHDDLKYNEVKFEEILSQQENEYEAELSKMQQEADKAIVEERENTAMKEGQLTAMMNKYDALKKKIQELKAASYARDMHLATEKEKNLKLEDTLAHFEQHIDEREVTLAYKEKNILSLQASNRTLDNFRYVLDHRVQQLQQEKGPIQQHVKKLEELIRDMHDELLEEFQRKSLVEAELESRDLKIKILTNDVKKLRNNEREKEHFLNQVIRELSRIVQMNHPKDIEGAVKDAYRVFVKGENPRRMKMTIGCRKDHEHEAGDKAAKRKGQDKEKTTKAKGASGVQVEASSPKEQKSKQLDEALGYDEKQVVKESTRQIAYMQKSLSTLQKSLKSQKQEAIEYRRQTVAQNSLLVEQCNDLRKTNRELDMKVKEYENLLRLQQQQHKFPKDPAIEFGKRSLTSSGSRPKSPYSAVLTPLSPQDERSDEPKRQMKASQSTPELRLPPGTAAGHQAEFSQPSSLASRLSPLPVKRPHTSQFNVRPSTSSGKDVSKKLYTGSTNAFSQKSHERGLAIAVAKVSKEYNEQLQKQKHEILRLRKQMQTMMKESQPVKGSS